MLAVVLGLVAGVGLGAFTVLVRTGVAGGGDGVAGSLVCLGLAGAAVTALAAVGGELGAAAPGTLARYAAVGLLVPGLSLYPFVGAVRHAGPARAGVLVGLAPLVSVAIAIAARGEPFRPLLVVGTVLIVAGCVSLAWERTRPLDFRLVGVALGVLCAVMFAGRDNLVRGISSGHAGPLAATGASLLGGFASLALTQLGARPRALWPALRRSLRPFLPAAVALLVGYAALVEALARGKVTVVSPLSAMQSLWSVAIAAVVVGASERVGPRLWGAGILVVAGGALVAAAR
jgi:drug/metabolite transporter (DMT)-like permease